jgi:molybdopterin-guanine dinucleotide biosynthesis protein A
MTATPSPRFGAILLAGGRASRMGGIDKPGLMVDGVSMRDRAIAAVGSMGADPVIVVGPESASAPLAGPGVRWVREDPPFSGPAAAVVTALAALGADAAEWTFLLACDLPRPEAAIAALVQGIPGHDGACLADADGRMQWLTGVYRTAALAEAAASVPAGGRDLPVRALLSGLAVVALPDPDASARDVDTWEDYEELTKEHP